VTAPPLAPLPGCPRPLATAYDVALLDLDGVVYRGPHPIPGASRAIERARAAGMRVAFITNNALRSPAEVAEHLRSLGVPAVDTDVVTSAQAAARLLAARLPAGARVLVAGGAGLRAEIRAVGLQVVERADDGPAAVVQGYDPQLSYARLAEAALAVRAGAWWVASNIDATIPTDRGLLPGNGALVALVRTATGRDPVVAGKPERALLDAATGRTAARRPLVVGDRLDTDIAGAVGGGCDSLLVFTGAARPGDLLTAPPGQRPTHLAADLDGLLVAHPPVRMAAGDASVTATCGGWTARSTDAGLTVSGGATAADDGLDALRALSALAWTAAADGRGVTLAELPAGLRDQLA
jgi:glycerol 3-phosphatase-2